jgi:hypothetical protein
MLIFNDYSLILFDSNVKHSLYRLIMKDNSVKKI